MPALIDSQPRAISVTAAAAALGVSVRMLRALIARGEIRTILIGRRRLVPAAEVERLAAEGVPAKGGRP